MRGSNGTRSNGKDDDPHAKTLSGGGRRTASLGSVVDRMLLAICWRVLPEIFGGGADNGFRAPAQQREGEAGPGGSFFCLGMKWSPLSVG